jgi:signal transduction histidine kinase
MALARITPRTPSHKKLEQDLEHITQEMYRRNKELADTNRTLSLLRTIDSLVLESHDSLQNLCRQMSRAISSLTGYQMVAIVGNSRLGAPSAEILGLNAAPGVVINDSLMKELKPSFRHLWFKSRQKSRLVSLVRTSSHDMAFYLGCSPETADQLKEQAGLKSVFVAKLIARQKLVGILVIGSTEPAGSYESSDLALLERLAEAVGLALDNKLLFEENQQVLMQLRKANTRLKELDQTKDEFISMASHQLRTPLTTIKGYLSMVLEGDVGPVTKDERKMLQQAFDGAERMVFLIADLLNISRLQSGKFVIENKPTDLAKMVESEVAQLQDTAAHHNLKLTFNKPDKFPMISVDDTKLRQVVMNFLDNAIYYTPAGGSIDVVLEATDDSISYTVTDTGLGVPKTEQHHLFTKFYRAGNARKMRPDGTGLGLFMAKKVVTAQGGAIIFKSTEGKGSTFGFSFPRKKVELKDHVTDKPKAEADVA